MSIYEQQHGMLSPSEDQTRPGMSDSRVPRGPVPIIDLGFPPRAVSGHTIDLRRQDIATPKLNGTRTLWNLKTGEVYNRKMSLLKQNGGIDPEVHHVMLTTMRELIPAQWVDMEFVFSLNQGVIIDVCSGDSADDADYHARRNLLSSIPAVNDLSSMIDFSREYFPDRNMPVKLQDAIVWKMPIYDTEEKAKQCYEHHKVAFEHFDAIGEPNQYLWEGIVVVDTRLPYELTPKQSMNLGMHTKYRFR